MIKIISLTMGVLGLFLLNVAYAADFGSVSGTVVQLLGGVSQILDVIAWVSGAGFAISAIVKYKEHRSRPQSVPLSGPITELIIAIILISFPFFMKLTARGTGHPETTTSYLENNNVNLAISSTPD